MAVVIEGGFYYAASFPAGGVFKNCTFIACSFGEGSVFDNCYFYFCPVGENSVLNESVLVYSTVGSNSTLGNTTLVYSYAMPPSFQSGVRFEKGQAITYDKTRGGADGGMGHAGGVIVWSTGSREFDECQWDELFCKDGALVELDNACANVTWDLPDLCPDSG